MSKSELELLVLYITFKYSTVLAAQVQILAFLHWRFGDFTLINLNLKLKFHSIASFTLLLLLLAQRARPTAELQCLKAFLRTDDHDSQNSLKSGSGHDMMLSKAQQIYTSKVSN